jgi:hypothetical protein
VVERLIAEGEEALEADLLDFPLVLLPSPSSATGEMQASAETPSPVRSEVGGTLLAEPAGPVSHALEPTPPESGICEGQTRRRAWVEQNIQPAMERAKIPTAYALAERAGVANDTIYKFLDGERWPQWKTQRKLITPLGLEPSSFPKDPGKI